MHRRRYLALLGSIGLAGCGALGKSTPDLDNDALRNQETASGYRSQSVRGDLELDSGGYTAKMLTPDRSVRYAVTTDTDAPIDVLTMERAELNNYREGKNALFFKQASVLDTRRASIDTSLSAGSYVLVFDNSTWGEASHGDTVTGTFSVEMSI